MNTDYYLLHSGLFALALSAVFCALLILASGRGRDRLTRAGDLRAVQAAHLAPTPRMGGVAACAALVLSALVVHGIAEAQWLWLMLSAVPLFLSGAAEDMGLLVKPSGRLIAALVSAALIVIGEGAWIDQTGVPGLDWLLSWTVVAIPLTILTTAGMAHAVNLIDGLNGLAGFTVLIASAAIAIVAREVGDTAVLEVAVLLGGAVLGFLIFNYPRGRIFFGDAGAYTTGFLLISLAFILSSRHSDVAPMAMMLMLFWPFADMMLAIYRRQRRKVPVSHPDRLHFHQLVMRALEIELFSRARRRVTNPLATLILLPAIALPPVLGVMLHDRPLASAGAFLLCLCLFFATYGLGMRFATRRTRSRARLTVPNDPPGMQITEQT